MVDHDGQTHDGHDHDHAVGGEIDFGKQSMYVQIAINVIHRAALENLASSERQDDPGAAITALHGALLSFSRIIGDPAAVARLNACIAAPAPDGLRDFLAASFQDAPSHCDPPLVHKDPNLCVYPN